MPALSPIYMWAGGKSRLVKEYRPYWPDMNDYDHYVEPFFGGGAIFCWLYTEFGVRDAVIGDINSELMTLLKDLREDAPSFIKELTGLATKYIKIPKGTPARKEWYYKLRASYWKKQTSARLYMLMRTGFNGIWQPCVASAGKFGTPAGLLNQITVDQIFKTDLLKEWSAALKGVVIHDGDYTSTPIPGIGRSLVYLDPPYRDSFTSYGTGFSDADQLHVINWAKIVVGAGHTVILANRCIEGDTFFEDNLPDADFHYFDVTYTAGRRKQTNGEFTAKKAREFIAIMTPKV